MPADHDSPPVNSGLDMGHGPASTIGRRSAEVLGRLEAHEAGASRYESQGEIARGAMGAILKVWDGTLRRKLAMKVVLPRGGQAGPATTRDIDPKSLGRFLEEAQITGQLDHPGVVPVHELGLDKGGHLYFTMRLVRGQDLKQVFDLVHQGDEDWSQTRALGVMQKVCEAMAYAHDKGVIHRDLKPANVMVGRFGEVYVMDWGLARVLGEEDHHDLRLRREDSGMTLIESERQRDAAAAAASGDSVLYTMDGDVVGTPAYMSPEQARGEVRLLDRRTDVYSVGAMLYHLFAGQMPFVPRGARVSPQMVVMRVLDGPPRPLQELAPEVPTELVAITEKAMARDPDGRYADMQELGEDLRAFLEHRVVKAYETGAIAEFKKWVVRNQALAAACAVALVALVVGLAVSSVLYVRAEASATLAEQRREQSERSEKAAQTARREAEENAEAARRNADLAREREAVAEREKAKVLRLSDGKRLEELRAEEEALWPSYPDRMDAHVQWIERAEELVDRLQLHREALMELRLAGEEQSGATWIFASTEDQWQHDLLDELVKEIEAFGESENGLLAEVRERLDFAWTVEERTLTGDEAVRRWDEAAASIADAQECPRYAGLAIRPQIGLLPIGRDPRTGLWEFLHLQTGLEPERNASGDLVVTEDTGIVLVLVPGGSFIMGAQSDDVDVEGYDPYHEQDHEMPPHAVDLGPFFISKYELTQGQWRRIEHRNPSAYTPAAQIPTVQIDLRHPVEQVTWRECDRLLRNLGLVLPTEAQWEYAARGGTDTPWWTGPARESLVGAVNLADQSGALAGADWPAIRDWPELVDGFGLHAPVGSLPANPFGIHEVHGNVWEWCLDAHGAYTVPLRPGDGLRRPESRFRIYRGGSFLHNARSARSAYRDANAPDYSGSSVGVRPARAIE